MAPTIWSVAVAGTAQPQRDRVAATNRVTAHMSWGDDDDDDEDDTNLNIARSLLFNSKSYPNFGYGYALFALLYTLHTTEYRLQ